MAHLSMYISVCRDLLQPNSPLEQANDDNWEESARKLKKLRQQLLCRVCKNLSADPYHSGNCQHLICAKCKKERGSSLPGCRFCKNSEGLSADKQAASVLSCYAKLCEILYNYGITETDTVRSKRIVKIWNIILEGAQLVQNFEKKNVQVAHNLPAEQASCSTGEIDDRANKGRHVCSQNNVSKDGGLSQDGRLRKDGRHSEDSGGNINDGDTKDNENKDGIVTNNEIVKTEFKNTPSDEEIHAFISSPLQCRNLRKSTKNAVINIEKLTNNLITKNDEKKQNIEDTLTDHVTSHTKAELLKNGVKKQPFLLEKNVNCTSQGSVNKRKLRISTSSEDRRPLYSFKMKRRKGKHDCDREYELEASNGKFVKNNEQNDFLKDQNNGNREICTDDTDVSKETHGKSNGYSKEKTNHQDPRKSHENLNGSPKTKLYRKNKYKCSCGSTGMKFYSDICSHERCACFAAEVPCTNCKCRFCSNPYKTVSDKTWTALSRNSRNRVDVDDDDNVNIDILS